MRTTTTTFNLTTLRGYSWQVRLTNGEDGKIHGQVTEQYVCTDEGYTAAPEGQKISVLPLPPDRQILLDSLLAETIQGACLKEQVNPEMIPEIKE